VYLLSIPGMRESVREGLETPLEECSTELTW
jgi:antitoxin YefM